MYNDSRNAICSTPSSNTSDYIAASAFSPFNTAAITAYLTMPTDEKRTSIFNLYINIITLFIHHVKQFCIKKYGYRVGLSMMYCRQSYIFINGHTTKQTNLLRFVCN